MSEAENAEAAPAPSLILSNLESWPEPVDGAELLAEIASTVRSYVVMDDGGAEAIAL
jgi:hypothetical protein